MSLLSYGSRFGSQRCVASITFLASLRCVKQGLSLCLGVAVKTGGNDVEIQAPVIISNAGMFTTFKKLLTPEIQANPSK